MMKNNKGRTKVRRAPRTDREGGARTTVRAKLVHGDWDDMPSTMSARQVRRGYLS